MLIIFFNNKLTLISFTRLHTALFFLLIVPVCDMQHNVGSKQQRERDISEAILFTRRVTKYYNCNLVASTARLAQPAETQSNPCDLDLL